MDDDMKLFPEQDPMSPEPLFPEEEIAVPEQTTLFSEEVPSMEHMQSFAEQELIPQETALPLPEDELLLSELTSGLSEQEEFPADGTISFVPDKQIREAVIGRNSGELPDLPAEKTADPLDSAKALPSLFPENAVPVETPEELPEPTVVKRPVYKKRKVLRVILTILRILGKLALGLVLAAAVLVAGLVGYLTVTEYSPAHAELAERGAYSARNAIQNRQIRIVTFNTGYGALGESADFFMDGGTGVNPESQDQVKQNMLGIEGILARTDADLLLLQEVDTDSDRSFNMNQWLQYEYDLRGYESRFALNYSCEYVPYPLPETIGKVNSGVATYSRYDISSATRYSLPCPFDWPVRVANLKRCMLVTRMPITDVTYVDDNGVTRQELVVVNVHLEAYDDGEGKAEQTRQLMEFIEAEYAKGNYVIVGGDFNQTFPNAVGIYPIKDTELWMPGVLEALPAGWQYAYDGATPTCRLLNQPYDAKDSATQYYVIDGFIVSPNVTVEKVETLDEDFLYSDHNPVVLDITLN